jgi:hypothetical protein
MTKPKFFFYKPKPAFGRTPCPKCEKGHTVWTGTATVYHFECSRKRCNWTTKPLGTGNGPKKAKFVPVKLPVPKYHPQKFDESFISETKKTITIRHRDGEILTISKVPYAEVVKRLAREKKLEKSNA